MQVPSPPLSSTLVRAFRIHQWVKNVLILLPVAPVLAVLSAQAVLRVVIAFLAFCFCASAVYVTNDLLDVAADRAHARKRARPFAAGELSVRDGLIIATVALLSAAGLALTVGWIFCVVLASYLALATLYSFWLKRHVLVDVFTLASLYTLRVIAGAAAIRIWPSLWILGFSMFFFYSLALAKRYAELSQAATTPGGRPAGRGYAPVDTMFVFGLGASSGMAAVLVLALYVNDPMVSHRYERAYALWALCPLILYWISRLWLKAARGELHDDPTVFALRDRSSWIIAATATIIVTLAQ